jgi:hypothetical protein
MPFEKLVAERPRLRRAIPVEGVGEQEIMSVRKAERRHVGQQPGGKGLDGMQRHAVPPGKSGVEDCILGRRSNMMSSTRARKCCRIGAEHGIPGTPHPDRWSA